MSFRWAIRGCGNISADFVHALKLSKEDHKVVALCASTISRCQQFADNCHLDVAPSHMFDKEDAMFAENDLFDVVYVGLLNHQHYPAVMCALRHHRNVVCEKPLGANVRETEHMIKAAKENNAFLMEGYWTRFFPIAIEVRQLITDGRIGDICNVMGSFGYKLHAPNKMDASAAGGALMATGCYLTMMTLMVMGDRMPTTLRASLGAKSEAAGDLSASAVLTFDDGAQATLTYTSQAFMPNTFTICGTKGIIEIDASFYTPTKYRLFAEKTNREVVLAVEKEIPLPCKLGVDFENTYPNFEGFVYEADAVRLAILEGKKEHPRMTHAQSLQIAEVNAEIRRQIGVRFPQDEERC